MSIVVLRYKNFCKNETRRIFKCGRYTHRSENDLSRTMLSDGCDISITLSIIYQSITQEPFYGRKELIRFLQPRYMSSFLDED
jgi:hypothetical protein